MTFTSWQFGVFVAIVFGLYYMPAVQRFQVQLLVLASVVFYGYGQPELLPLLLTAILGTYLFLVLAFHNRAVFMPAGIAFNLALLAFFKYKFLFVDAAPLAAGGAGPVDFLLRLPLPIGISFFVFHKGRDGFRAHEYRADQAIDREHGRARHAGFPDRNPLLA